MKNRCFCLGVLSLHNYTVTYTIRHKKRESSAYYLLIATGLYIVTYFIVNHDTEVEEKREVNFYSSFIKDGIYFMNEYLYKDIL